MTRYNVEGMTCGGCAAAVTKAIHRALPGAQVEASFEANTVEVGGEHDEAVIAQAVEDAGFDFRGRA